MEEHQFSSDDLFVCDWQYTIRHTSTSSFILGEKVFLKSNPERQMTVHFITEKYIITTWLTDSNQVEYWDFPPECIIQYKYAGLLTWRGIFNICLN